MTTSWRDHVSPHFLLKATIALGKSQENTAECHKLRREVRGELMAIELRSNRTRQWRGPIFRAAADVAKNPCQAFQWSNLVAGPLEQIAKDAEKRLRSWP